MRLLAALLAFVLALVLLAVTPGWAVGGLSERGSSVDPGGVRDLPTALTHHGDHPSVYVPRSESLYQGKPILWWARRAVQARKDANARGRTIKRLKAQLRGGVLPWYWLAVGSCESGLRWTYNGSSGFDGAFQFHPTTWSANRLSFYPAFAYLASPFQQLVVAEIVLSRQGWGAWPACSRKVGLR